jgi:hypothetical protein
VAPDLLGLGLSDRLPRLADHTVDRHAESIVELVESLDLRGAARSVPRRRPGSPSASPVWCWPTPPSFSPGI